MASVPEKEVMSRQKALRGLMRKAHLGGAVITSPTSVHYYSGFTGEDTVLFITAKKLFLITDFRYLEEAEKSTHGCSIVRWKKNIYSHCGQLIKSQRCKAVGFEASRLTVKAHIELKKAARGTELKGWDQEIMQPRATKSAWEVRAIRKALKVAEDAFTAVRSKIIPGMLETELTCELEYEMTRRGASGPAFPTIIAAGANASLPHAHPGRRKIRKGGLILIDWGARVNHYNSDLTRTLFVDSIPPLWRRRYEAVLEAQLLALQKVAGKHSGQEADAAARGALKARKLDKYFGHSLGHGVGLEVHELPVLSSGNREKLAPGSVVTVEPGVYFARSGGIRIEDMVLVEKDGGKVLSRLPKDVDSAVV